MKSVKNERNLAFGGHLSGDFSDVSQQESKEVEAWVKEQEDIEFGWKNLNKQKAQIQRLKRELFSTYVTYRKNLCQTLKQFCLQSGNQTFNYSKLLLEQVELNRKEDLILHDIKQSSIEQKQSTMQKIISQRRIKRYYKTKHEINYQDQLDPEDDEKQIYQIYQDAFLKDRRNQSYNPLNAPYNTQLLSNAPQIQRNVSPSFMEITGSRNQVPQEHFLTPYKQKLNYLKVNDPFVGFQADLSFESRNEHYYPTNKEIFDSFARNIVDKYDAISEGGKELKNKSHKEDDQLSHKDNLYKNFIEKQNQQLQRQKMRVQQLTDKAFKVLNNGEIDDQEEKGYQMNEEEDKIAQFKYLLGQIIETFSVSQVLKFLLKFKSFQILIKLYEHASEYFGEVIEFQEPLKAKYLSQIVLSTMPEQQEQGINIVIYNIFGSRTQISYEEFLQKLTPSINELQYNTIEESSIHSHNHKSLDLAIRLFNVWIELDYFQNQIKKLLEWNQNIVQKFIAQVTEDGIFSVLKICDFMTKAKKTKLKKLKTQIFFRKITGQKLNLSQFYRWLNTKKPEIKPILQQHEEPRYQYYYNLY